MAYKLAGCCRSSASRYRALLFDEGHQDFTKRDIVLLELAIAFCAISSDRRTYNKLNFARLESALRLGRSTLLLGHLHSQREIILPACGLSVEAAVAYLYPDVADTWLTPKHEDSNVNDFCQRLIFTA